MRTVAVSAPELKFTIGFVASMCAVLFPRLIAALTIPDKARITFISLEYLTVMLIFSALVGVVVTILEWRVPRAPRDTFMTTLGLPAILAGALSANQNTLELQAAMRQNEALAEETRERSGIPIESEPTAAPQKQGALIDLIVTPVYAAQGSRAVQKSPSPRLGIIIEQPRYFIVLDRAASLSDARTKLSQIVQRLKAAVPDRPLNLQIEQRATEFLVTLAGGPRVKSEAVLEAVRLKDAYHMTPTLVQAPSKD
jgi:hypothetical protein